MADAAYSQWLEDQMGGSPVNWLSDTIKVVLVSSAYVFVDGDKHYSDLTGILGEATLTGKTCTSGVLDADDAVVSGPLSGTPHAAVILKWTGTGSTSRLMLYLDDGVGFQPWGGDVNVLFPNNAGIKIFPLGGGPA
jgi:hypothetical protein